MVELLERFYWLAFSAFPGVGPVRFALLLSHFGSAKAAWEATTTDLLNVNFGEKLTEKFDSFRRTFDVAGYGKKLKDLEVATLILTDEKYPILLKQIPDPPFVLYVKGRRNGAERLPDVANDARGAARGPVADFLPAHSASSGQASAQNAVYPEGSRRIVSPPIRATPRLESHELDISKTIAVVGTRKMTSYGKEVTTLLTQQLVQAGLTIVSGLAFGIDAAAHEAAIAAGGKTIAVLGCGVDCCYPTSNRWLYDKIIDGNGIVVSEMPLSHRPSRGLFPARNRIISGLSLGVLVTEGAHDSGALITARNGAEQGREVFAVPGPITSSLSKGPTELIKKGAKLVTTVEDILEEFQISNVKYQISNKLEGATEDEKKVIQILENEPIEFDEIVRSSGLPAGKVGSLLSIMELKGMVKDVGNNVYGLT